MVEVILKLAASCEWDYIIAESAVDTNMEPQEFSETLHSLCGAYLRVDTLVSVLYIKTILDDFLSSPLQDAADENINVDEIENGTSTAKDIHDIDSSSSTSPIHEYDS